MDIGQKLKEKRREKNLTQQELADILHVTRQTISSWEVGRTYPDLDIMVKLSDLYETPLDDLLREDSSMVESITKSVKKSEQRKIANMVLSFLLFALLMTGFLYIENIRSNQQVNEQGLSASDLLNTSWEMSYDPSGDTVDSYLSFEQNNLAIFNRYSSPEKYFPADTNADLIEKKRSEWMEKGLVDGTNTYHDLEIDLVEDQYHVAAHGYSQVFTKKSDTVISDEQGREYYQVLDSSMHDTLFFFEDEFSEQN